MGRNPSSLFPVPASGMRNLPNPRPDRPGRLLNLLESGHENLRWDPGKSRSPGRFIGEVSLFTHRGSKGGGRVAFARNEAISFATQSLDSHASTEQKHEVAGQRCASLRASTRASISWRGWGRPGQLGMLGSIGPEGLASISSMASGHVHLHKGRWAAFLLILIKPKDGSTRFNMRLCGRCQPLQVLDALWLELG
jgi:hypothetical protein